MKVLLTGKYSQVEPIGLMFLSTELKRRKIEHEIYLYKDMNELLKFEDIDFLGISVYTGQHLNTFLIADEFRERGSFVILGGPHATYFVDDCMNHADAVIQGEGYLALADVISEKKKGKFLYPLVEEHKLPDTLNREELYRDIRFANNPMKNVMASLGCPYSCSYCYNNQYRKLYHDFKVRLRDVRDVIVECSDLMSYPLKMIFFQDDYFGFNLKWLEEFSVSYNRHIGKPFHCQIRPEGVTKERMDFLRKAGCTGITVAVESANDDIRINVLNRNLSGKRILDACKIVKEYGFKLRTEQMIGLPLTDVEDELRLLEWNVNIKPDIAWASTFVPYRGTDLGEYCVEKGLYDGVNDDIQDSFFDRSVLNFDCRRKTQIEILQHLFGIFAHMPEGHLLARECLKEELDFRKLFQKTRKHLYDNVLYSL